MTVQKLSILILPLLMLAGCATGLAPTVAGPTGTPTAAPTQIPSPQPTVTQEPTASPTPLTLPTVPSIPSLVLEPTPTEEGASNMRPTVRVGPGANPTFDRLVEQARSDLAARLKISPDAITLKQSEAMEWPDGSLGCGRPGMFYIQVITPGYLLVLQAEGKDYEYHTSMTIAVFCR